MLLALLTLTPAFATQPVVGDADDPAIWVNRRIPAQSRILGTDKKGDRLYVFDLQGRTVQILHGLHRPNNVDVLPNFKKGFDLAMVTEREGNRLRAYRIDRRTGRLTDVSAVMPSPKPMGIALWKDAQGTPWAFVSPKDQIPGGAIRQYRLSVKNGMVHADLIRRVGTFDGGKEIESLALDDNSKVLWYSDEGFGNKSVDLVKGSPTELRLNKDYEGDHEGIAVWNRGRQTFRAYTNQLARASIYRIYDGRSKRLGEFTLGADSTDGIDACGQYLGPKFPKGIFVAMNSKGRNFFVVGLDRIESGLAKR